MGAIVMGLHQEVFLSTVITQFFLIIIYNNHDSALINYFKINVFVQLQHNTPCTIKFANAIG